MKKSLSLLLAIVMVFSAFSSLAFAADSKTAAQIVAEAGIIKGDGTGNLKEDDQWTRQDVAILLSRFYDEEAEAQATAKNHTYADVTSDFYDGYLTWARDKGLMEGHSDVKFGFDENINAQQFATVLLRVLGIDFEWDDALEVAIENGLIAEDTDNSKPFTRGASFAAIVSTLNTEVEEGVTLGAQLGLKGFVPEPGEVATAIASFKAVGAKKLEVVFNGKVDPTKVEFSVKRDTTISVNVAEVKLAADNTSAVLELATNIVKGEFTVNVKGVAEEEISRTISTEDEKITNVELIGDVAGMTLDGSNQIDGAQIGYRVFNQYGENVTDNNIASTIDWQASLGSVVDSDNGVLTLSYPYMRDQVLAVTAVVTDSVYVQTFQIKIGDIATVRTIEVKELYHPDGKELKSDSNFAEFVLLLEAQDQYGKRVDASQFNNQVSVVAVPSYANVATNNNDPAATDNEGPNNNQLGLRLADPVRPNNLSGKTTITFIPRFGGTPVVYELEIIEAPKVAKINLSSPGKTVALNDVVEIPFTAVDQYGEEITNFDTLNSGQIQLSNGLAFEPDYVNDTTKLKFTASTKGLNLLMAVVLTTGDSDSLRIDVKDPREAKVVANTKDLKRAFAVADHTNLATATLEKKHIVVHDQYGEEFDIKDNYRIYVEAADGTDNVVGISGNLIQPSVDGSGKITYNTLTLTGKATGTERIRIKLQEDDGGWKDIKGSEYEFTMRVVKADDVSEFVVKDLKPVYGGTDAESGHNVSVDIFGKLGDNTEVVLPTQLYQVNTSVYGLNYVGGKLDATAVDFGGKDDRDIEGIVIVSLDAKGGVTITKDVVATSKARVVTTAAFKDLKSGVLQLKAGEANMATIYSKLELKDQYGVKMDTGRVSIFFNSLNDKAGDDLARTNGFYGGGSTQASITNANEGDTFTVNVTTANGVTTSVKVVVVQN